MAVTTTRRTTRAARALVTLGAAAALTVGLAPAPAQAQTGSINPEQLANQGLQGISPESLSQLLYLGNLPGSSGSTMMGLANRLGFSPNMFAGSPPPSPQPNPNITESKVIDRRANADDPRYAKWYADPRYSQWLIDSGDMQRGITVEVYRAANPGAPTLYLLDGVGSEQPSGFMQWGAIEQFRDQNVNLVIPTGGQGTMWADWNTPDPVLGISKWEKFITQDLPRFVEPDLRASGKRVAAAAQIAREGRQVRISHTLHRMGYNVANRNEARGKDTMRQGPGSREKATESAASVGGRRGCIGESE